jgi:hypothetical protein
MWIGIVLAALIGLYAIVCIVLIALWVHYLFKIWNTFPLLRWITLEEAAKTYGVPEWACEVVLPDLYRHHLLEIRPRPELSGRKLERANRMQFNRFSVYLFEFRMVQGGSGRRKRPPFSLKDFAKHFPGLEPPAVPA